MRYKALLLLKTTLWLWQFFNSQVWCKEWRCGS